MGEGGECNVTGIQPGVDPARCALLRLNFSQTIKDIQAKVSSRRIQTKTRLHWRIPRLPQERIRLEKPLTTRGVQQGTHQSAISTETSILDPKCLSSQTFRGLFSPSQMNTIMAQTTSYTAVVLRCRSAGERGVEIHKVGQRGNAT